jgi:hypothetical protein
VNAIPGVVAQIVVDGAVVQTSAAPGSVVGPLALGAGRHVLELRSGSSVVVNAQFSVAGGASLDVVAHRAADQRMTPLITVFRNDLSPVGPGKARLVVSHVAVAEPADIRLDRKPYFRNVANAESLSLTVPAGGYSLDVVPTAGVARSILAPVRVLLTSGTLTRVFAYGDPAQNTSDAIVQILKVPVVGAGAPSSVSTGDGGQAADQVLGSPTRPWNLIAVGVVSTGLVAVLLTGVTAARRGALRGDRFLRVRPRA